MRVLIIAVLTTLAGCSTPQGLIRSTSAGPKDIAGIEQFKLGTTARTMPPAGFKEVKRKSATGNTSSSQRTFVTAAQPQPGKPTVNRRIQLTYINGKLAEVVFSFTPKAPLSPEALLPALEASIRSEYSPGLVLNTKSLQLNDAQGDLLAVSQVEDMVAVTASRASLY